MSGGSRVGRLVPDRPQAKLSTVRSTVDSARQQNRTYMAAGVATLGWVFLQASVQVYASSASRHGAYGLLGAFLPFVTWLYFAGIVILLGAAVNAVQQGVKATTPQISI